MNHKALVSTALSATLLLCSVTRLAHADDSAASIAAGGLVSRRETRVVMAKEVLRISLKMVTVDYDFRNDTDEDVTTEVAFPIPPYTNGINERLTSEASFANFRLQIAGKPAHFLVQAKAFLDGKDVSGILATHHIDITTFGHYDWKNDAPVDFQKLPRGEQVQLVKEGLFEPDQKWENWTVRLQYHWPQTFPAHSVVHIRHEYARVEGYQYVPREAFRQLLEQRAPKSLDGSEKASDWDLGILKSFCPTEPLLRDLERGVDLQGPDDTYAQAKWVDFVLTTANTWRRPIEDFTLIVERGAVNPGERTFVTFCQPESASVQHIVANRFELHLTNFVPKSELHIGFIGFVRQEHRQTPQTPSSLHPQN